MDVPEKVEMLRAPHPRIGMKRECEENENGKPEEPLQNVARYSKRRGRVGFDKVGRRLGQRRPRAKQSAQSSPCGTAPRSEELVEVEENEPSSINAKRLLQTPFSSRGTSREVA